MATLPEEKVIPLTREEITAAVQVVFVQHGYVDSNGEKDLDAMREAIYSEVSTAVVARKTERGDKAVLQDEVIAKTFEHLPDVEEADNPELAEEVQKEITATVRRALDPAPSGAIQKLLDDRMPGYLLCRTKIGKHAKPASYVTKDLGCILEDFAGAPRKKVQSAATTYADHLALATNRLPEHADKFNREYKRGLKLALDAGASALAPSLTAASDELSEDDE
jgi:hypothetical protein